MIPRIQSQLPPYWPQVAVAIFCGMIVGAFLVFQCIDAPELPGRGVLLVIEKDRFIAKMTSRPIGEHVYLARQEPHEKILLACRLHKNPMQIVWLSDRLILKTRADDLWRALVLLRPRGQAMLAPTVLPAVSAKTLPLCGRNPKVHYRG